MPHVWCFGVIFLCWPFAVIFSQHVPCHIDLPNGTLVTWYFQCLFALVLVSFWLTTLHSLCHTGLEGLRNPEPKVIFFCARTYTGHGHLGVISLTMPRWLSETLPLWMQEGQQLHSRTPTFTDYQFLLIRCPPFNNHGSGWTCFLEKLFSVYKLGTAH